MSAFSWVGFFPPLAKKINKNENSEENAKKKKKKNLTEKPMFLWDGTVEFCLEFTSSLK